MEVRTSTHPVSTREGRRGREGREGGRYSDCETTCQLRWRCYAWIVWAWPRYRPNSIHCAWLAAAGCKSLRPSSHTSSSRPVDITAYMPGATQPPLTPEAARSVRRPCSYCAVFLVVPSSLSPCMLHRCPCHILTPPLPPSFPPSLPWHSPRLQSGETQLISSALTMATASVDPVQDSCGGCVEGQGVSGRMSASQAIASFPSLILVWSS